MAYRGKHAKPSAWSTTGKKVAMGSTLAVGVALPVVAAGPASAATYSAAQVAAVAKKNCPQLSAAQVNVAVKISHGESGWNTNAHNPNGENSKGLWQINQDAHGLRYGDLFNVDNNARAMCAISSGGTNWRAWTVYTSGMWASQPGYLGPIGTAPAAPPIQPSAPIKPKAAGEPVTPPKSDPVPRGQTVTIKPGDTLWDLSPGHNWVPVWEKNKDIIKDPDLIFPGQQIKM